MIQQGYDLYCFEYDFPLGRFRLEADEHALKRLIFVGEATPLPKEGTVVTQTPLIREACQQLSEYFEGRRTRFDLPLAPEGTPFQQAVWAELSRIPYGMTASYSDIAARIGRPRATRAVGGANNKNPLPLFIPCHRVIGKSGRLTGYAGGLELKAALLELEKRNSSYLAFTDEQREILKGKDPVLAAYMDSRPMPLRRRYTDRFYGLVDAVVSQQISTAAKETIMLRLSERLWPVTAGGLLQLGEEALRQVGLSAQKAQCLLSAAELIRSGGLDLDAMDGLSDAEVIRRLTAIKGIGAYTAEMLLIFAMDRPDVLSYNDLGIKKGLMRLYGLSSLSKKEFAQYQARFSPLGTLASLYLWALAAE